jgi:hypothetical protein
VAKRVRGSQSTHRSGGHAQTRPQKPAVAPPPAAAKGTTPPSTWDADIDGAIGSVAMQTAEVRMADPAVAQTPGSRPRRRTAMKADSLEARVAAENIYVLEDLRRIAVVTAILLVSLAVAWVLFVPLNLLGLY